MTCRMIVVKVQETLEVRNLSELCLLLALPSHDRGVRGEAGRFSTSSDCKVYLSRFTQQQVAVQVYPRGFWNFQVFEIGPVLREMQLRVGARFGCDIEVVGGFSGNSHLHVSCRRNLLSLDWSTERVESEGEKSADRIIRQIMNSPNNTPLEQIIWSQQFPREVYAELGFLS